MLDLSAHNQVMDLTVTITMSPSNLTTKHTDSTPPPSPVGDALPTGPESNRFTSKPESKLSANLLHDWSIHTQSPDHILQTQYFSDSPRDISATSEGDCSFIKTPSQS